MRRRVEILCVMVMVLLLASCNRAPIEPDKMEDILFDIYRTDACFNAGTRELKPEQKVKYYDSVFEKHGVTKEEFDEALDWYAHHTKEWLLIHENLEARTTEFVTKVDEYEFSPKAKPLKVDSIDTLDLWVPLTEWEWRDGDAEIDRRQTDFTLDDRKYFTAAANLKFEMKMRCWGKSDSDSVTTMMVLRYSKGNCDTLRYVAPVDSVERIYRFSKQTRGMSVSMVRVVLMDTVEGLKGVNVAEVRLKYAYNNKLVTSLGGVKRDLWVLRRDVRNPKRRR